MKKIKHNNYVILQITTAIGKLQQQLAMMYKIKHKYSYNLTNWMNSENLWKCNIICHKIYCNTIVKLGTKAKQTICYCSTLESLSLTLEGQYLIITGSISLSTMWSVFLNFSSFLRTCDSKLSQFFGKTFVLQTSRIKSSTFDDLLVYMFCRRQ